MFDRFTLLLLLAPLFLTACAPVAPRLPLHVEDALKRPSPQGGSALIGYFREDTVEGIAIATAVWNRDTRALGVNVENLESPNVRIPAALALGRALTKKAENVELRMALRSYVRDQRKSSDEQTALYALMYTFDQTSCDLQEVLSLLEGTPRPGVVVGVIGAVFAVKGRESEKYLPRLQAAAASVRLSEYLQTNWQQVHGNTSSTYQVDPACPE